MAKRVTAARAAAAVLLGLAVSAALVGLGRSAGQGSAGGAVADRNRPAAGTPGGPAAGVQSAPTASVPAGTTAAASTPGAGAGGPGRAAADPCRLVSGAEAAAALQRPVARIQRRQGFLVRSCVFSGEGGGRQLVVQVDQGPAASETQFRMGRTPGDQRVAGVGDEAWFTPDTGLLDVRAGTARFQVGLLDVAGGAGARVPRRLLALARLVAGRV
jgi:hypothetical protein